MFIIIGLIAAFVLIVLFSNRRTRACRWREDRSGGGQDGTLYRCVACGANATTTTGKPPVECLRFPPGGRDER